MIKAMRPAIIFLLLAPVLCTSLHSQPPLQSAPEAGGVQAQGRSFQYVRSISGSKGAPENGKFVMQDPRAIFYLPEDHQVIVYMEWEGPVGNHHIEAFWKNPEGKVVTLSDFSYDAKDKRFGAFWTLALSETMQQGTWTLEAHVDGQSAGLHSFEILSGAKPPDATPSRHPLKTSELYDLAVKSSVLIEKLDGGGKPIDAHSGFVLEPSWVVTAFEAIDGASKVRITFSDGRRVDASAVSMWNPRQDWAVFVLGSDTTKTDPVKRAPLNAWSIGDNASILSSSPSGNRVIGSFSISGKSDFPAAGPRINFSPSPASDSIGAALLDDYGEVVGLVAGGLTPGATGIDLLQLRAQMALKDGIAVPITLVSSAPPTTAPTSFAEMMNTGQFIRPVTAGGNIEYGQLAHTVDTKGAIPAPIKGGDVYSRREPSMYVYIMWEAKDKVKANATIRIFDLDNHLLNQNDLSKPVKVSLGKGDKKVLSVPLSVVNFSPGFYRIDVWLDDVPAWRKFFQVTE